MLQVWLSTHKCNHYSTTTPSSLLFHRYPLPNQTKCSLLLLTIPSQSSSDMPFILQHLHPPDILGQLVLLTLGPGSSAVYGFSVLFQPSSHLSQTLLKYRNDSTIVCWPHVHQQVTTIATWNRGAGLKHQYSSENMAQTLLQILLKMFFFYNMLL